MKAAGIVAEYNPFHNGHKAQIDALKNEGYTHIVSAMSGNFVQRGECAIADKWTRAYIAIKNGVDLVVEIPTCYCLAPAEKYAFSAVSQLDNLKAVNTLCFGSETGEIDKLKHIANTVLCDQRVDEKIGENLKSGVSFALAQELAVENIYGKEYAEVLKNPNDVLGIEYLSALKKIESNIEPFAIKRVNVGHNDTATVNNFASASLIRQMINSGEDYQKFVPPETYSALEFAKDEGLFPVCTKNGERAVLSRLRDLDEADFEKLADVSEGFHNRLCNIAVKQANSLEMLFTLAKTKRYTLAKIRRLIFNATLRIYNYENPPYIRVLGFSENGKDLLKLIKEKSPLPIVTSYADAKKLSENAKEYFEKEACYTDFYSMLMPKIAPKGLEFSQSIVKI